MSHFLQPIFSSPIRLSPEQREKPYDVLSDFFADYPLQDLRHVFWQILKTCLTSADYPFDEPSERDSLLALYESLETVLEAAFVIAGEAPGRENAAAGA